MSELINSDSVKYKKSSKQSFKKEAIKLGAIALFIFLFSGGIIGYIAGLILWDSLFVIHIYGSLLSQLLILYCLIFLPIRIFALKRTGSKWTEIRLLFLMAMTFVIIFTVVGQFTVGDAPAYIPAHGFRHRINSKADIPAIRKWLKKQKTQTWGQGHHILNPLDWPECIEKLKPRHVDFWIYEPNQLAVVLSYSNALSLTVQTKTAKTICSSPGRKLPLDERAYIKIGEK